MSQKTLIWLGVGVGSTLGGVIPGVFGAGWLSLWGIIGSAVGGLAGVWAAVKLYNYL